MREMAWLPIAQFVLEKPGRNPQLVKADTFSRAGILCFTFTPLGEVCN
jgi:hypothetical protein